MISSHRDHKAKRADLGLLFLVINCSFCFCIGKLFTEISQGKSCERLAVTKPVTVFFRKYNEKHL